MRIAQVNDEIVTLQAELVLLEARSQHVRLKLAWLPSCWQPIACG